MGQRSYVLVDGAAGSLAVLESNNALPLLWVGLLAAEQLEPGLSAGPTLRLVAGAAWGVTLKRGAALEQLASRRDSVACWLGDEAAVVLDQLGAFLHGQPGTTLHIDLSEWVELSDSVADATQELQDMLLALSTPAAKRRPRHVREVLERVGLLGLPADAPAFGTLLGGEACSGREPWRRDPPRERRRPDDDLRWKCDYDRLRASDDGRVLFAKVSNRTYVQTPVRWHRGIDAGPRLVAIADDAVGHLHPTSMSADGTVLIGSCHVHPGNITRGFKLDKAGVTLLGNANDPPFVPVCADATGTCAAGWFEAKIEGRSTTRAAIWRESEGLSALSADYDGSHVYKLSSDGGIAAGTVSTRSSTDALISTKALVWEGDAAPVAVAEFFGLDWQALAPTGHCGVLKVMTGYGVHGEPHFWRIGEVARPILNDAGQRFSELIVSPGVTLALGQAADGISFWWPDRPPQRVLDADEARSLEPVHVASCGTWFIARETDRMTNATKAIVVWDARRGLTRHALDIDGLQFSLYAPNRAETLDQFVLMGSVRQSNEPLTWTLGEGVTRWGAVPRA